MHQVGIMHHLRHHHLKLRRSMKNGIFFDPGYNIIYFRDPCTTKLKREFLRPPTQQNGTFQPPPPLIQQNVISAAIYAIY